VQEYLVMLDQPSRTPVQRAERYIDHRNDADGQIALVNPNLWSFITRLPVRGYADFCGGVVDATH